MTCGFVAVADSLQANGRPGRHILAGQELGQLGVEFKINLVIAALGRLWRRLSYLGSGWTLGCEPAWNGVPAPVARLTTSTQEPLRYRPVAAPRPAST
jgi:hypothetical protein